MKKQPQRSGKPIDVWRFMPFWVAAIIVVITVFVWYEVAVSASERNKEHFEVLIHDTQSALHERYALYEQSLWGGLGLFHASKSVEREEWRSYVRAIQVERNLPGISGVGYIDYVDQSDLVSYLEEVRSDGAPLFVNHPDTNFRDKFIIKFIEPVSKNKEAVGLDIGFESNRREAAERARDLGVPALTKKIELVQDNEKRAGFLLLIPYYNLKVTPLTLEGRRKHFVGWVYAPFIGSNFLQGLTQIADNQVDFEIYDGDEINPEALIFSGHDYSKDDQRAWQFLRETKLNVAGQTWTIVWHTTSKFDPPASRDIADTVFGVGILFALIMFFTLNRLIRSKEHIAEQVAVRTEELKKAQQQATHANSMKSEFLANMSHEIRTPLNGVIGAVDLLKKTDISKAQTKYLNIITSSGETLLALINDILDLSKIESGELEINADKVVLRDLVQETVQTILPNAKDKKIDVTVDYEGNVPISIVADSVRLNQILTNLLSNAVKFVDAGYIIVRVREILTRENMSRICFEVEDTGIGIEQSKLEKIFDKFAQADASTTKQFGGTGLGLAITQRLVSMMGGQIKVTSKVGVGTTFWFELEFPVLEGASDVDDNIDFVGGPEKAQEVIKNLDADILLVENEMVNQMIATELLEGMGCRVDLVENGQEALDKLAGNDNKYDVILMDCMMPVMDGFEATEEIRKSEQEGEQGKQVIIAMTANAMAGEKEKCLEIGMDDYLSKPVNEEILYDKLLEYTSDKKTG